MDTIALLSHASPTAIVAYRSGLPITARQFLDDAAQDWIRAKVPKPTKEDKNGEQIAKAFDRQPS